MEYIKIAIIIVSVILAVLILPFVFLTAVTLPINPNIDRENPRNAMKTLHKAAEMLKDDRASVGIYPEGTRSRELKLLPFHNGVFRIAKEANVPIVVAAMRGTEKIKENFPFHSTTVYVDYVDVITSDEAAKAKNADIGERVGKSLLFVLDK